MSRRAARATGPMASVIAVALVACGAAAAAGAGEPARGWRQIATAHDRERLREWRSAWVEALASVGSREGQAAIAADPALYDPDRHLTGARPPAGDYRCRATKLGAAGAGGFAVRPWGRCRVEEVEAGLTVSRLDGQQRPTGLILADTDARAIFLGTMVFSDERSPQAYGRDAARDMAGVVERVGTARWRIILPYPRFESTLDVVELVPAAS